jgi:transcriptional regulator with XRE-family HTH domain
LTWPDGGSTGGTVLRMLLGAHLRRLREARGISREDAGWRIRASESKISRMELGRVGFKERDVADLLTLYGLGDSEERTRLIELAREANAPEWWRRYGDVLPSWFQYYLGLEAAASLIRTYEVQFVPGLLQTRDYARAVVELGHDRATPDEIEQAVLTRADAPQVWVVIDEAALRRPIGGREVMRAQLEALLETNELPNVRLQVIPFEAGGHAAAGGAFTILRFPEPDLPDVVYTEQLVSAHYLDKRDDVEKYLAVIGQLCLEADPPHNTADTLKRILDSRDF